MHYLGKKILAIATLLRKALLQKNIKANCIILFICTTFVAISRTIVLGRTYFRERFAFILDLKSGQFQLLGIISKVLTSMLYIYPFAVGYIPFGVGYCLLQVVGSPEPQIGNSNSSHAFFYCLFSCLGIGEAK